MDPLSIASAIVTSLQIANQIKQSIEQVGHTHKKLVYLTEDVIQGLSDLEEFCAAYAEDLRDSNDLRVSLEKLKSQLSYVLRRCQKYCDAPRKSYISKLKANFKMWRKVDEVERDITRLKELIQSSLTRFNTLTSARIELATKRLQFSSARTENRLLASESMHKLYLRRFDSLFGYAMNRLNSEGISSSIFDNTNFDEIDYQYINFKVQTIISRHALINLSQIELPSAERDDSDRGLHMLLALSHSEAPTQKAIGFIWKALQFLDELAIRSSLPEEYLRSLILLGGHLNKIHCHDSAILVHSSTAQLLQSWESMPNGRAYVPFLGLSLSVLTWSLSLGESHEIYEVGQKALVIHRKMARSNQDHDPSSLRAYIYTLRVLTYNFVNTDRVPDALLCATEILLLIYSDLTDNFVQRSTDLPITWEVYWSPSSTTPSPLTFRRDPWLTQSAGFCLYWAAWCLSALGRYDEAIIAGRDAISILKILQDHAEDIPPYLDLLTHYTSDLAQDIPRWKDMNQHAEACITEEP